MSNNPAHKLEEELCLQEVEIEEVPENATEAYILANKNILKKISQKLKHQNKIANEVLEDLKDSRVKCQDANKITGEFNAKLKRN